MPSISKKITILDFFAFLSTVLIGVVGYLNSTNQNLLIDGLNRVADEQGEMRKELSSTNTFLEVHTSQILSIKDDLSEVKITQKKFKKEILIKVNGINARVYKLEGAK